MRRSQELCLPAVYHQGACIRWALGFDLPDKSKQTSGVVGDPMIGPASEVKLSYLSDLMNASLYSTVSSHSRKGNRGKEMRNKSKQEHKSPLRKPRVGNNRPPGKKVICSCNTQFGRHMMLSCL